MNTLNSFVRNISDLINHQIFGFNRIWPIFGINCEQTFRSVDNRNRKSLIDDIMTDGLLLAVQKKRRTVERRLARRFGVEKYPQNSALIRPKHNLIVCDNCGHYHELHTICGNCYKKVREESNKIIAKIREHFNYTKPVQKEVHVLYNEENRPLDDKPVIEMETQRPEWFAKNLLSKPAGNKWTERNPIVRDEDPKVVRE